MSLRDSAAEIPATGDEAARAVARPPALLVAFLAIFIGTLVYLVATSLVPRDVPVFSPVAAAGRLDASPTAANGTAGGVADGRGAVDTVTFDARDPERWHYFSLGRGLPLTPPDTGGWELAVRRYHVIVPGAAADLGPVELDRVQTVPDTVFAMPDGRTDAGHPALRRWYRYGMLTHLLESKRHVYVVRRRDGSQVALQVLSYYCPGPTPGCLTIRYTRPLSPR